MPQAIAYVGAWAIEGLITLGVSEALALTIVDVGIKIAGLALLGEAAKALSDIPDLPSSAQSNAILVRGTVENQRIIYGEVLVGGTLVYINSAGTHNQALFHLIAVAGHEVEDISDMWLDDIQIPDAYIDWSGDGSVDSGDFRGNTSYQTPVYFSKAFGGDSQLASVVMSEAFTEWTSAHRGRGIAYFHSRFDFFENQTDVWSAGPPSLIRGLVKGKKVYDPRSDSTQSFGSGPHRLTSSGTWEWSDNPALCWADYLIDNQLGVGIDTSKIDYGYVASAAEICDETVFTPVGTDKRFRCNGTLSTGNTYESNIKSILTAMNGSMARVNGQWKVKAWGYETPTLQLNENHLAGDIQMQLESDERDRYNTVRGQFIDPDRNWQAQGFPQITAAEYVSRDNGEVKYKDIQLPMTTDIYQAQRLAFGILEKSDLQKTVVFPANFNALSVEINSTIKLSLDKMNWTDKEFRVVNYSLRGTQGVNLVLREEAEAAYSDVGTAEYIISSQGVYITNDPGVPPPSNVQLNAIPNGVYITWVNPPARLYEYTQIWRAQTNSVGAATEVKKTRNDEWTDIPKYQGVQYYWLRSENYAGEVSSWITGVNSGSVVIWGEDTDFLTGDPQFSRSGLGGVNSASDVFWRGINSWDYGDNYFYTQINSTGTVKSPYLHQVNMLDPLTGGGNGGIHNQRYSPITPGIRYYINIRYRVAQFINMSSVGLWVEFEGRQPYSLGPDFSYTVCASTGVVHTNSVDWQVFSQAITVGSFSMINTPTMVGLGFWTYGYSTAVGTGQYQLSVDHIMVRQII